MYVLWAIGRLSARESEQLKGMTPKLQHIYSHSGNWHEIVAKEMALPNNMVELINRMWEKNQLIAARRKEQLTPQLFAQMFVEQNFHLPHDPAGKTQ